MPYLIAVPSARRTDSAKEREGEDGSVEVARGAVAEEDLEEDEAVIEVEEEEVVLGGEEVVEQEEAVDERVAVAEKVMVEEGAFEEEAAVEIGRAHVCTPVTR